MLEVLTISAIMFGPPVLATTYFISPNGSDSSSGTSSSAPLGTFANAISKLRPGDTLILRDGMYSLANSGLPAIDCARNAQNGANGAPITVRAENERQAFIKGDGSVDTLEIRNCSYWTVEGLHVESADNSSSRYVGGVVSTYGSDHLVIRRLLLAYPNRWVNVHLLQMVNTSYSLVEENEGYHYHRHGLSSGGGDHNIFRRNYVNGRDYPTIPEGYSGYLGYGGEEGICLAYPGSYNTAENNIIDTGGGYTQHASGPNIGNRYFGNIAIGTGLLLDTRGTGLELMPQDSYIENLIITNSQNWTSVYFRGTKNTRCVNCTVLSATPYGGFGADPGSSPYLGDGSPSAYIENSLAAFNTTFGFGMFQQASWSVDYSNSYGNSPDFYPYDSHVSNSMSIDPKLGSCKAWIPDSSPMKRAGRGGADIGANVLYRYQDGVLTNQPLWNPSTGAFTCGAIVAGLNDVPGKSCFDVHARLNINRNGCPFPAGYGGSVPSPSPAPAPTPAPTPSNSTAFRIGERVQVNSILGGAVVRQSPGYGTVLGDQSVAAFGTVVGGPMDANGYTWWQINYDTSFDGWSTEGVLMAASPIPAMDTVAPTVSITSPVTGTVVKRNTIVSMGTQ
jgi:hypothetical protein